MRQHRKSMPCLVAWHLHIFCLFGRLADGAREARSQHSKKQRILSFVFRGPKEMTVTAASSVWGTSTTLSESLFEIKRGESKFVLNRLLPARLPSLLAGRHLLLHAIARIGESSTACAPSCFLFSKRSSQIFGLEEHWKWEAIFPVLHVLTNSQRIPLSSTP